MSLKILQQKSDIEQARKELEKRKVSFIDTRFKSFLRRFRFLNSIVVGDRIKSWDVLLTLNFIEQNLKKNSPILDIGCYASEIILSLNKLGYTNLVGIDLNPNVKKMPRGKTIQYEVGNFMQTKFPDASFSAITSISVIEHGFNATGLLREASRILKSGGYFIASFDYWEHKINTDDEKLFGVDWKIFSGDEVKKFINDAADYGLYPVGETAFECKEKTVEFKGRQYTFAWMVLRKQ